MYLFRGFINIYTHEYTKEMKDNIKNDEDGNNISQHTNISYILDKKLLQSGISDLLDLINCILTTLEIIFYIASTYSFPEEGDTSKIKVNAFMNFCEIIFIVYFSCHFFLRFYVSQDRFFFLFKFINFVDYATIIVLILSQLNFFYVTNTYYFLKLGRMIRLLYLGKIETILQRYANEQIRSISNLFISLIGIIFLSTSVILELENYYFRNVTGLRESSPNLTSSKALWSLFYFHDMLYFEVVTLTTIGFGDITPKSDWARIGTVVTIIILIAVVPALYSQMSIVFGLTSKYSRIDYKKNSNKSKHLIILGECGPESFEACLEELYHEDHGDINFDTIIMQSAPNDEMVKLCEAQPCNNRIYYLVGDPLNHIDLKRCKADRAICVLIFANKQSKDLRQEDFANLMKSFSVKKYISMMDRAYSRSTTARVCIQLLLPESKHMFFTALSKEKDFDNLDQIICVEEIKLQMIGKSCLCQGINTVLAALITSQKPTIKDVNELRLEHQDWYNEYLDGLQTEIYAIKLKSELIFNMNFIELATTIYNLTGYVVIGIDVIYENLKPFVCLNPVGYLIAPFDHLIYLLAYNQPDEKVINELLTENLKSKQKDMIDINRELVKIKRAKPYWMHLGNDGHPKEKEYTKTEESPLIINSDDEEKMVEAPKVMPKKFSLLRNTNQTFTHGSQSFLYSTHPRTQRDSECFSDEILDHHILICGIGPNLKNLIMPLRTKSIRTKKYPILILDKADHIPSELWKEIQYFPEIYFMQGNAIRADDLRKANASRADAVIILGKKLTDADQNDMIDADTIFIYKAIKNEVKKSLIIAELNSSIAIGFISSSNNSNTEELGFWLSEAFACGELYLSSMLDTLVCQVFYNPYIMNIIQQMLLGEAAFNFTTKVLDELKERKIVQSTLYLLRIKEQLDLFDHEETGSGKMQYQDIYNIFIKHNMVPIGLLRNPIVSSKQKKSYVFLAPPKHTEVNINFDKIYVLSCENETADQKNLANRQTELVISNMKLIEQSNEVSHSLLDDLKEAYKEIDISLKAISNKKLIEVTRSSLRNEFVNVHQRKIEEITKIVEEEIAHEIEEKSEDCSEKSSVQSISYE